MGEGCGWNFGANLSMKDLTITFQTKERTYQSSKTFKTIDFSSEQIAFLEELMQHTIEHWQENGQLKDGKVSLDKFELYPNVAHDHERPILTTTSALLYRLSKLEMATR